MAQTLLVLLVRMYCTRRKPEEEINLPLAKLIIASGQEKEVFRMDIAAFEEKLNALVNEISDVPTSRSKKIILLTQKKKSVDPKLKKSETLDESLEHLRLIVKYLLFDLEATRRENLYLRKMLENHGD